MAKSLPVLSTLTDVATTRSVLGTIADSTTVAMTTIVRGFVGVSETIQSVGDKLSLDLEPIGPEGTLTQKLAGFGEGIQKRLDKLIGLQSDTDDSNEQRAKLLEDDKRDAQAVEADKDRDSIIVRLDKLLGFSQKMEKVETKDTGFGVGALLVGLGVLAGLVGIVVGLFQAFVFRLKVFIKTIKTLSSSFISLGRSLGTFLATTFKNISTFLGKMLMRAGAGLLKFINKRTGGLVEKLALKFIDIIRAMRNNVDSIKDFFVGAKTKLAKAVSNFTDFFVGAKTKLAKAVSNFTDFFKNSPGFTKFINDSIVDSRKLVSTVVDDSRKLVSSVTNVVKNTTRRLIQPFDEVVEVTTRGFNRVKKILDFGGDSKIMKMLSGIGDVFTKGTIGKSIKIITKFFTKFKGLAKLIGGPITMAIFAVIEAFQAIPKIWKSFSEGGIMAGIETSIDELFRILVGDFGNLLKDGISWVAEKLGFENLSKALDGLDFTKFFDEFTDKVFSGDFFGAFDVVVDEITKFFDTLFGGDDKGEGIFASMQSKFKSFGDEISNFVTSLLGYFTPVKDYILGFFDSYPALKTVKDTITDVFDNLGDTFGNIIDKLKSVIDFFSPTRIKEVVVEKLGALGQAGLKLLDSLDSVLPGGDEKEPSEKKERKREPSEKKEQKREPSVKKTTPSLANRLRLQSGEGIVEFHRSIRKSKMLMFETIQRLAKNGEISETEYVKFHNDIKGLNQLYTIERVNSDTKVSKESVENFVRAKFGIEKNTRSIEKVQSDIKMPDVSTSPLLSTPVGKFTPVQQSLGGDLIENLSNTTSTGGTTIIDNTVVNNTYNTDNSRSSTANVVTNPIDSKLSGGGMDRPL